MENRINFSAQVKRIVASRAGYRCSIPVCGRITIGPDLPPDKYVLTGIASHIFSASGGGPRGQGGLPRKHLKSVNNAIWLCSDHAKQVDSNRGLSYSPQLLVSYKSLQEAKTSREQHGIFAPIGWFQQLTLHVSPLYAPKTLLQFGKVTLIIGGNSVGKSALCDWLAGFGDPTALWRWLPSKHARPKLEIEVLCHTPEPQTIQLSISPAGPLRFWINEKACPIQPLPLRFVFVREPRYCKAEDELDDVDLVCGQLNVDPVTLPNLFPIVDSCGFGWVRNLRFVEEQAENDKKPKLTLYADVPGSMLPSLCFRSLSHSQETRLLIELAVALARFSAQFTPTMLILDSGMNRLDSRSLEELATNLMSSEHLFQTVIILTTRKDNPKFLWAGWQTVILEEGSNGTTVNQNLF
jgi:ABC-type transport system involved in cytochrome c biogenesis ATPase subunit